MGAALSCVDVEVRKFRGKSNGKILIASNDILIVGYPDIGIKEAINAKNRRAYALGAQRLRISRAGILAQRRLSIN